MFLKSLVQFVANDKQCEADFLHQLCVPCSTCVDPVSYVWTLSHLCGCGGVLSGDRRWRRPSHSPGRRTVSLQCESSCVFVGLLQMATPSRTPCTHTASPRCAAVRVR